MKVEHIADMNDIEILLVEDNPYDAEMTINTLKNHNLANRLHHVRDGAEALDFVFRDGAYADRNQVLQPKVILLDLKLPKLNGIEVLHKIKSNETTKTIPVVILTSSTEDRDMVECYKLGVNSYIVKPVVFEAFAKTVAELGFYWMFLNKIP